MTRSGLGQSIARLRDLGNPGGALWVLASQVLTSGANFLTSVMVIRAAGLEEFGRFTLAFLVMMILRNFLVGCVLAPMSSIGPKLRPSSQGAYRGFLLASGLGFAGLTSALAFLACYGLGLWLQLEWLVELAPCLALANALANLADLLRRYQFDRSRPRAAFAMDLGRYGVQIAILSLFALGLEGGGLSATTALAALAIGSGFSALAGLSVCGRLRWRGRLAQLVWPRHWQFIRWMTPGVAFDTLQSIIPQFATVAVLGEAALGLVRAVQQIANVLNIPFNALQQALPSIAARRLKRDGLATMRRFLSRTRLAAGLFSATAGALVVVFRHEILSIMGIGATPAATLIVVCYMALNVLITMRFADQALVAAVEDPGANFWLGIAGVATAIVSTAILLPQLGALAVPLVGIANATVTWLVLLGWIRRNAGAYRVRFD